MISMTLNLPIQLLESLKMLARKNKIPLNQLIKTILADRIKVEYAR